MVGKMAISINFQMIIFFSSELFPTEVRGRGVSTAFMMSRLGSMGAPFITDLVGSMYPWAPFVIFGLAALLAGAVTFLLPETRGQVLPDTVAHLEARERKYGDLMSWEKHLSPNARERR
ncbi:Solute carrier family 22 member 6 [Chionoecetes opilio]|uniref:Solute carrier family 22 member 6 n=1 Tax=Chionoecetes opilio TaxID=41210 RepID=A0A8J4Y5F0_CHIOP|nr:Solute carrier family 22 member 6 [Chionoecetes opilio]